MIRRTEIREAEQPSCGYVVEPQVRPPQPTEPALCWCCRKNPPTWGWHWMVWAYGWFYSACSECRSKAGAE